MTDRSMLRCPCVALVSLLMACGSGSDGASDGADGSGTTNGSGDEGSDAGDDGDDGDGGDGFAPDPDVSGPDVECSTWGQDCNDGDRCIPWNGPNGVGTRCVPIGDQPKQPGEPCILDSDDVDDCDIGATCWGIDPNTEIGTCMEMCTGAPATPQCGNPDNDCVIVDTVRPLCLSPCHPLLQD